MSKPQYDVAIIGAGISGIGTAYWLQKKCPEKRFIILEARSTIGGTWSLFKYPGIRSDSDMFTFGYRFKPWTSPKSLSDGQSILNYLKDTVSENDLEKHILYNHKMESANWSDDDNSWTIEVREEQQQKSITCRFLSICTGYYDYDEAYRPNFKGEESYAGQILIPQFWPKDLDYENKKITIIGSGATAVTLVPALTDRGAEHVTMLQRSPTYIMNLPNRNGMYVALRKILPDLWAYRLTRWQNISLQMLSFGLSKVLPGMMKSFIMKEAAKQLPEDFPVEKHFNPSYNPWDQRLCVVPDGDLFEKIKAGKASVVTDQVSNFTADGIELESGDFLKSDMTVVATGLKMQLLGGASLSVNNTPVKVNDSMVYKGMMIGGLPNFIYAFGYTNASWTLKVDLTANYLCKLLNYMDRKGYEVVTPQMKGSPSEEPFLNLSSGYIKRAQKILPRQGKKRPWRVYQSYLVDMIATRFGRIRDNVLAFK